MTAVLVVEPSPGGHRFAYVRYIIDNLPRGHQAVLLTSVGASASDEYRVNLGQLDLTVLERFAQPNPPTPQLVDAVATACRERAIALVLVMDADLALKRWWWDAWRPLRSLSPRPEVSVLLTRYPMRSALRGRRAFAHRIAKSAAILAGMLSGSITRAGAVAGHEDTTRGLLVSRVRDPAFCTAHSRDRIPLRAQFGLPADRKLVGIFGQVTMHKYVPMLAEAVQQAGADVDLLVVGRLSDEVADWLGGQTGEIRERIIVRPGFLDEEVMDGLLASCDIVSVAQNYDRPSAVMGRAFAADVPVVTAGSKVRERELRLLGGGLAAQTSAEALADAVRRLLASPEAGALRADTPMPTPRELTMMVLGRNRRVALWEHCRLGRSLGRRSDADESGSP